MYIYIYIYSFEFLAAIANMFTVYICMFILKSRPHAPGRSAWLSRDIANMGDVIEFNPDVPRLTTGELEKELASGEVTAEDHAWTAPIDEVFSQPDILRTTFLWQVKMEKDEWEHGEDECEVRDHQWACLPHAGSCFSTHG